MGAAQHWLNGPTLGFTHWASSRGRPQRWRMNGHASSRTVNCERWTQWCGRKVGSPVARLGGDDADQSEVTVLTAKPRPRRVTTLAAGTESIRLTTVHVQHHAERAADEPSRHKGEITCIEQRGVTKKIQKVASPKTQRSLPILVSVFVSLQSGRIPSQRRTFGDGWYLIFNRLDALPVTQLTVFQILK